MTSISGFADFESLGARSRPVDGMPLSELLDALLEGWCLPRVVPLALDAAERAPLVSAGRCPGDLVRALMDVPNAFWSRYPGLFARYQSVVRANAAARRALPVEQRLEFWAAFDDGPRGVRSPRDRGDAVEERID